MLTNDFKMEKPIVLLDAKRKDYLEELKKLWDNCQSKDKNTRFHFVLNSVSYTNNFIDEWKITGTDDNDVDRCFCSESIEYKNIITNVKDGRTLIIGSTCVKKFMGYDNTQLLKDVIYKNKGGERYKCDRCGNHRISKGSNKTLCGPCSISGDIDKYPFKRCVECRSDISSVKGNFCKECYLKKRRCQRCDCDIKGQVEESKLCINCEMEDYYARRCKVCFTDIKKLPDNFRYCRNCYKNKYL